MDTNVANRVTVTPPPNPFYKPVDLYRTTLDEGPLCCEFPSNLSPHDVRDMEMFFNLILIRAKRRVATAAAERGNDGTT